MQRQFASARATLPFVHAPRVAFRCHEVVGNKWALLPSAAGVIDPLLSTGFPLTLLGLGRLLDILETTSPGAEREAALRDYERTTQAELDVTEQLVGALYNCMGDPDTLQAPEPALLRRRELQRNRAAARPAASGARFSPQFASRDSASSCANAPRSRRKCPPARHRAALFDRIDRAIEPFDTAGLLDRSRRDWYPMLASDLIVERIEARSVS